LQARSFAASLLSAELKALSPAAQVQGLERRRGVQTLAAACERKRSTGEKSSVPPCYELPSIGKTM